MRKTSSSDPGQPVNKILPNHRPSSLGFWAELDEISTQSVVGGNSTLRISVIKPSEIAYSGVYHWW